MKKPLIGLFILVLAGFAAVGYYYGTQKEQSSTERITITEPTPQVIEQIEVKRETVSKKTQALQERITIMQKHQQKQNAQIEAFMQTAKAPLRVPELPTPTPLLEPAEIVSRAQARAQLDPGAGHTLPKRVMEQFTQETGLTQDEIEQAMNK